MNVESSEPLEAEVLVQLFGDLWLILDAVVIDEAGARLLIRKQEVVDVDLGAAPERAQRQVCRYIKPEVEAFRNPAQASYDYSFNHRR